MIKREFETEYNKIFERALFLSEKTRREGLLALEDCINEELLCQRDVMELGLRLACDGTDLTIIDNILTNIINQENDNDKKLLKTIQKNAALMIHQGYSKGIFALTLNSYVDIGFENAMEIYQEKNNYRKLLSSDKIDKLLGGKTAEEETEDANDADDLPASDLIKIGDEQFELAVTYLKGDGVEQDYAKADELFRKSLEMKKESCGEDHVFTALACYLTADRYREHEDYEIAISYYQDALAIYKKVYDKEDQDITDTLCYLGICYEAVGDYKKAVKYFIDTAAMDEEVNGKGNENIAVYYNQISICYVKLEDFHSALKFSRDALAIREEIFGKEHSSTAHVVYKIAEIYYLQEDYENALVYYDKAYKVYSVTNGKEDDAAVSSYFGIAACYEEMKEYEKALIFYNEALASYEKTLGKDNEETAVTYFSIASCYYNLKDYEKALENDLTALAIREKICEESAPELSVSFNNAGSDCRSLGRYEEALKYHLKALELRKKHCEKKDYIAFSYCGVGKDYEGQGDKKNALKYFKEALSIYESLEGFEDDTETTRQAVNRNS